ncbi:MAG TPA: D-2-hydroxyacid dehydrogenase [Gemmatimonadaceae bacterium]|nr:D-2-hydroxyacid dehydrogenase [Gemmatimonadaceae bacterium]
MSGPDGDPMSRRLLAVDLAATSQNWALQPDCEQQLMRATPAGWDVQIVRSPTSSDGDGPPRPSEESLVAIEQAEVYFGFGLPRPLFEAAKRLRWAHSAAAGVGNMMYDELRESDVLITNSAGVHAVPIAEYVVAGVLHFLRGLDLAIDQQRRTEWNKQPFVRVGAPLREMDSVRALIVGTGGLGGETARRLSALGARCTGVRRRVELGPPDGFDRVVDLAAVDAELPTHDVIVLAAPLTPSTDRLMTAERLDRLPASAIVINVSRGALLDEEALASRVASGRLRGAVVDVFQREPLAADSPLWQLRSVLLTPHISPVSPGRFWPRQMELFLDNWGRYLRGEALRNVVDKRAGY